MGGRRRPDLKHVVSGMIMQVDQSRKDSRVRTEIDLDRTTDRYSLRWFLPIPGRENFPVPDEDVAIMENRSSRIHGNDGATDENALCGFTGSLCNGRSES